MIANAFGSKKFVAAVIAAVLALIAYVQGLSTEQVTVITAGLYLFIGAQGFADVGKERAKIEADASVKKAELEARGRADIRTTGP